MEETLLQLAKIDRSAFSVIDLSAADDERDAYWRSRTPEERLAALELSRQIAYGYDPTVRSTSRFFRGGRFERERKPCRKSR